MKFEVGVNLPFAALVVGIICLIALIVLTIVNKSTNLVPIASALAVVGLNFAAAWHISESARVTAAAEEPEEEPDESVQPTVMGYYEPSKRGGGLLDGIGAKLDAAAAVVGNAITRTTFADAYQTEFRPSTDRDGRKKSIYPESVKTFLKKSSIVALDPDTRYEKQQDGTMKQLHLPSGVDDSPNIISEIARGGVDPARRVRLVDAMVKAIKEIGFVDSDMVALKQLVEDMFERIEIYSAKRGGFDFRATISSVKNSLVDTFFDDALHEYGIYFDDLVNGASVSLENVDKFLKDHHVKVRNEEPNVPNRPMDHQEPSIKFTETTLRDAWESWAKLTHPDEQGKALGIITSYAKDIARQFEDMKYKIKGATPIVKQVEIILARMVPAATNP